VQFPLAQSLPKLHVRPLPQPEQPPPLATAPPLSMLVSSPFLTPSEQVAPGQIPPVHTPFMQSPAARRQLHRPADDNHIAPSSEA